MEKVNSNTHQNHSDVNLKKNPNNEIVQSEYEGKLDQKIADIKQKELQEYKLATSLHRVVVYAKSKADYRLHKKFIFGFMGGVFVGIAYLAYMTILSWSVDSNNDAAIIITQIAAAMIFPVGIIALIFLGGNLFTSNCLISLSVKLKVIRKRDFLEDLAMVFISNLIGGISFGLIMGLVGTYSSEAFLKTLFEIATKKVASQNYSIFYTTFFSGILCNVLVAGSIFAYTVLSETKGIATFVVYILIATFAVFGFQHIVANMSLFSAAAFASLFTGVPLGDVTEVVDPELFAGATGQLSPIDYHGVTSNGDFFFRVLLINFPLATLGNLVGGIFISEVYFFAEAQKLRKIKGIDIFKQLSYLKYDETEDHKKKIAKNQKTTAKKK